MNEAERYIIKTTLAHYPTVQAIYLFGSYGTENEWPNSDIDVALLLPHAEAKQIGTLQLSNLQITLTLHLKKDIDLVNIRQVSTVFQKEIITAERRIFCADQYAADEFEMLVLSFYQRLNVARKEILDAFWETKRAYPV